MNKVQVKICMGTTCFVMGAAALQELVEILPEKYPDKVEVSGVTCLELCSDESKYTNAPYVMVNDEVISDATIDKVIKHVERLLENGQE